MKRLLLLTIAITALSISSSAQKLIIGERSPEMRIDHWLDSKAASMGKPRLVEFYHSTYNQRDSQLATLNRIATLFSTQLEVIIITKEEEDDVEVLLRGANKGYYVAFDDAGKTFTNFGVNFIPFSVLIDGKGRVVWFGNSATLQNETITKSF